MHQDTLQLCGCARLLTIASIDLPLKVKRSTKTARIKRHKKNLGTSIDERPVHINDRNEFGHREIDTVIGKKDKSDAVLLTMTERMTQKKIIRKIPSKIAETVQTALLKLADEAGECFSKVFKSIMADNGSEFAELSLLKEKTATKMYFAHTYSHLMSVVLMSATMVLSGGLFRREIVLVNTALRRLPMSQIGAIHFHERYY